MSCLGNAPEFWGLRHPAQFRGRALGLLRQDAERADDRLGSIIRPLVINYTVPSGPVALACWFPCLVPAAVRPWARSGPAADSSPSVEAPRISVPPADARPCQGWGRIRGSAKVRGWAKAAGSAPESAIRQLERQGADAATPVSGPANMACADRCRRAAHDRALVRTPRTAPPESPPPRPTERPAPRPHHHWRR